MGGGVFGAVANVLLLIALIILLYKFFVSRKFTSFKERDTRDSLMILDSRLAKGEITEEEYRRLRAILTGNAE